MPRNRALRAAQGAAARACGVERFGRSEIWNGSMVGNILPSGKPTYNYGKSPGLLAASCFPSPTKYPICGLLLGTPHSFIIGNPGLEPPLMHGI